VDRLKIVLNNGVGQMFVVHLASLSCKVSRLALVRDLCDRSLFDLYTAFDLRPLMSLHINNVELGG